MTLVREPLMANDAIAYGFLVEEDEQTGALYNRFVQLFYSALDTRRALACSSSDIQVVICEDTGDVSPLNLAAALHKDNPLRDIYLQKTNPSGLFISRLEAAGARGSVSLSETESLLGLPAALKEGNDTGSDITVQDKAAPSPAAHEEVNAASVAVGEAGTSASSSAYDERVPLFLDAYYVEEEDTPLDIYDLTYGEASSWSDETAGFFENGPGQLVEETALQNQDSARVTLPEVKAALSSPVDIRWLEQVLDLDDLDDDIPVGAGQAVMEKPALLPKADTHSKQAATQSMMIADTEQDKGAAVAAFVSGRGGVGKSSLTVLTGMELWQRGLKVALLDMDLQFGDLSILAGHEPKASIKRMNIELLCNNQRGIPKPEESLLLIEPPQTPELAEELIHQVPQVLIALRSVVDVVLINTSCLWNEASAVLARSADRLVICMDQRATSVSAARQTLELCVRLQIPSTRLSFLLNRCSRSAPITDIDASLAMGGVDIISISEGGTDVDELLSLGCPLELLSAQPALRQSLQGLGTTLLNRVGRSSEGQDGKERLR